MYVGTTDQGDILVWGYTYSDALMGLVQYTGT